jgi:hypothetical protein
MRNVLGILIPSLINFMPLIVTVSGWVKAYRARRVESLHPFAFTLLSVITAIAAVPAGAFVYYALRPVHLPPWRDPQVLLIGPLFLLGPFCIILSFLAFRKEPKWLFWALEVASFWLTGLGFLAVAAY